jgi:hypothetical protein
MRTSVSIYICLALASLRALAAPLLTPMGRDSNPTWQGLFDTPVQDLDPNYLLGLGPVVVNSREGISFPERSAEPGPGAARTLTGIKAPNARVDFLRGASQRSSVARSPSPDRPSNSDGPNHLTMSTPPTAPSNPGDLGTKLESATKILPRGSAAAWPYDNLGSRDELVHVLSRIQGARRAATSRANLAPVNADNLTPINLIQSDPCDQNTPNPMGQRSKGIYDRDDSKSVYCPMKRFGGVTGLNSVLSRDMT